MKICPKCETEKEDIEFYESKTQHDKLQTYCIICSNKRRSKYYLEHRDREIEKRILREKKNLEWYQGYKKTLKCSNCPESRWYTLDFHHTGDDKEYNIGAMARKVSLETLQKEIDKCIVLCSNCHREHHHNERTT